MNICFRLECPKCKWGHPWNDKYINQGWLKLKCHHCSNTFYVKISLGIVNIEISEDEVDYPISNRFLED